MAPRNKEGDWTMSFGHENSDVSGEITMENPAHEELTKIVDTNPNNPRKVEDWYDFLKLRGFSLDDDVKKKIALTGENITLKQFVKKLEETLHQGSINLKVLNLTGELLKIAKEAEKE